MNNSLGHDETRRAREALEEADHRRVGSPRDRRIYGIALALIGLILGAALALQPKSDGPSLFDLGVIALLIAVGAWSSTARTTPRSANRVVWIGLALSILAGAAFVVLRQVLDVRGEELTWPIRIAGGVLNAAPLVIAGLVIGRGGRR